MAKKSNLSSVVVAGATPLPPAAGVVLQWDGRSGVCREVGTQTVWAQGSPSSFQATGPSATAPRARPYWTTGEIGLVPGVSLQAVAWEQEAARLTFSLDPALLANPLRAVLSGTSGELVWEAGSALTTSPLPAVHPVVLVHTLYEAPPAERLTLVPSLLAADPLLRHITLVLRAALAGEGVAGHLYTQSLTDALVVHFLRRYSTTQSLLRQGSKMGGLSPYKLRRTLAYIKDHLSQSLSLVQLAAVGQTSPAHFARLFKLAMGLTPHQYVIACRMEHAKQLLAETDVPLSEVALRVGCTDHSHFSALFRAHVDLTPTAYRVKTRS